MYVRPDLSEGIAHGAGPRWCTTPAKGGPPGGRAKTGKARLRERVVGQQQPRRAKKKGLACRKQWLGQPREGTARTVRTASTQRCARGTKHKEHTAGSRDRTVRVRQVFLLTDLIYNSERRGLSSSSWQGRKGGRHMRERESHENDTEVLHHARYPRANQSAQGPCSLAGNRS